MAKRKLTRRDFLRISATTAVGAVAAAACQPAAPQIVEVEKPVVVEKEVVKEVPVEKVVVKPAEQVVLTHTFWGDPGEWKLWVAFDDRFSAENPGVTVISEHIPTAYEDQIMLRRAAGDMPDVLNMQDEPFPK